MDNLKMADLMLEAGYTDMADWLRDLDSITLDLALQHQWLVERGYQVAAGEMFTTLTNACNLVGKVYAACQLVLDTKGSN